jgi:hypothetical protein
MEERNYSNEARRAVAVLVTLSFVVRNRDPEREVFVQASVIQIPLYSHIIKA